MPTSLDVKTPPPSGTSNGHAARSTVSSWDTPSDRLSRWDGPFLVLAAVVAMALLASIVGVGLGLRAVDEAKGVGAGAGSGETSATSTAVVAVTLTEMAIKPTGLEVPEGAVLEVANAGSTVHSLVLEGAGLSTPMIEPGGTARLDVGAMKVGSEDVRVHHPAAVVR